MFLDYTIKDRRVYYSTKEKPRECKYIGFGSSKKFTEWISTSLTIVHDGGEIFITDTKNILVFEKTSHGYYNENYNISSKGIGDTEIIITLKKNGVSKSVSIKFEVKP